MSGHELLSPEVIVDSPAQRKAAYMKRWRAENRDKIKARSQRQVEQRRNDPEYRAYKSALRKRVADRPNNRESVRKSAAECRKRHPEKYRARRAVSNAINAGSLIKPSTCSKCSGGGKLHAHHSDYSKPLDIIWVCIPCHNEIHHEMS